MQDGKHSGAATIAESSEIVSYGETVKLALQNCHAFVAQVSLHSSGKKKAISSIFFLLCIDTK